MAETVVVPQVEVSNWKKAVEGIFAANKTSGRGTLAIIAMVDDLRFKALGVRNPISDDIYIARGLGNWDERAAALGMRVGYYLAELKRLLEPMDAAIRWSMMYTRIVAPILYGKFPAVMFDELPTSATAGIRIGADGNGSSFGDAVESATLWNQAVWARQSDDLAPWWAISEFRGVMTEASRQLELSAPGEDPTATDAVVNALKKAGDGAAGLFDAVGGNTLVKVVLGGVFALGVLYVFIKR